MSIFSRIDLLDLNMQMRTAYELAKEIAETHHLTVRQYLIEHRQHFLFELSRLDLFVPNRIVGAERIQAADITFIGANQIRLSANKTIAQYHADKHGFLQHPTLPCIAVKKSAFHYDYQPLENVFYVYGQE